MVSTGIYIEYDNISRIKYWPDSVTAELIADMAGSGYGERILLGTDFALRTYWLAYGGGPGMSYLMERFVPRLREAGLDDAAIDRFLIHNPAMAFSFK